MPPHDQQMARVAVHADSGHAKVLNHEQTPIIKCDILIIGAGASGLAAVAALDI